MQLFNYSDLNWTNHLRLSDLKEFHFWAKTYVYKHHHMLGATLEVCRKHWHCCWNFHIYNGTSQSLLCLPYRVQQYVMNYWWNKIAPMYPVILIMNLVLSGGNLDSWHLTPLHLQQRCLMFHLNARRVCTRLRLLHTQEHLSIMALYF